MKPQNVELAHIASGFAAIGSQPRLGVILALVRAGPNGLTIGEIGARLKMPASTLAHHLRFLSMAGLVKQEKTGRSVVNRADFEQLQYLVDFILSQCCADMDCDATQNVISGE